MLILAVDTSSTLGSLALLRDTTILSQRVSSSKELYSAAILRDTKQVMDDARISFEEIRLFAVDAGPGSFTGLRVGLTTVKAWAEVWRKPIAALSGLEAMAAQVLPSEAPDSFVASAMDARRGQIFGGLFVRRKDDSGVFERVGDEILATADEFLQSLRSHVKDGGGLSIACISPGVIQPALQRHGLWYCRVEVGSSWLAPSIGQLGDAQAIRRGVVDALRLDADSLRRPHPAMS